MLTHRLVLPAVATALLAVAPVPARAAADSEYRGGCGFDTVQRDRVDVFVDGGLWSGVLYSATLLYSSGSPGDNPVSATVTCTLLVNGQPRGVGTFAGTVVVAGAKRLSFFTAPYDHVQLCETVDFTSNDTPTHTECQEPTTSTVLPNPLWDALDAAVDLVQELVDPALCPLLAGLAPGGPGVVDVGTEGDVAVAGVPVWDCGADDPDALHDILPLAIPVPPECSDGVDNDLDGDTDYPADRDCWGPDSDAEGLQVPSATRT